MSYNFIIISISYWYVLVPWCILRWFADLFSALVPPQHQFSSLCEENLNFHFPQSNPLCLCVCVYMRMCVFKVCANPHILSPWQGCTGSDIKNNPIWTNESLGPDFRCSTEKLPTYYSLSLHTNSSQLSKHVKHFHTSVLLQMLFYFLNEWRNPSGFPYVILAWIPKPYATIFNLISMYSLLLYQTIGCLISKHLSLFLPTVSWLFRLSSSSKMWVVIFPPSTWELDLHWLKSIRYSISLNIGKRFWNGQRIQIDLMRC